MTHFSFFESYHKAIKKIKDPEERLALYDALLAYMFEDEDPELGDTIAAGYFDLMQPTLDKSKIRAESGRKGGEKSKREANEKQNESKTKANAKQTPPKEKEKEKEKEKDIKDSCTEQSPGRCPAPEPLITIPLNDGTEHGVTSEDIEEYKRLYPAVDIMQEIRNMRGWCQDNPKKKKTKSGIRRFIGSWLSKEQNRGRASPQTEKNRFNRFPQQEYDIADIKQRLVANA